MNEVQKKKSRRNLFLVVSAFVLPIILAKLALTQDWLDSGVTNKGLLIENEVTLNDLGITDSALNNMWLILYVLPTQCNEQCEQTLSSVNNTFVALGREMPRVKNVALYQQPLTKKQFNQIDVTKWIPIAAPKKPHTLVKQPIVLLVDPLGNIILAHQTPKTFEQQPMFGKGILADMKKLLKYSKIG